MELAADYPAHVVCTWIGNSEAVARKHYLRITEADFDRAAKSDAESDAPAAQNPAQRPVATISKEKKEKAQTFDNQRVVPILANTCDTVQSYTAPRQGLEPWTKRLTGELSGSLNCSETRYLQFTYNTLLLSAHNCKLL
jgi:hypothetical protein